MKKELKKAGITILKCLLSLVKNLLYILYLLIHHFNNFVAKVYLKLPRILKVVIIYTLIFMSLFNLFFTKKDVKVVEKEVVKVEKVEVKEEAIEVKEETKKEEKKETEKETTKKFDLDIENKLYNEAIKIGMNDKQALVVVAISRHETGKWTSSAFKNKNNFGGMMKNGKLATFENQEEGLQAFVKLLKIKYFDKGLNTIEKIGAVYCPVGASNDPNGLNKNWVPNVIKYYNEYLNR